MSDTDETICEWSADIEEILDNIKCNSGILSNHYKKQYMTLKRQLHMYKIPVIILSGINSIFSVGLTSYLEQNIVSVINCLISLMCSIIVSIELYTETNKKAELSINSYRNYYLLDVKISAVLKLDRTHRAENPRQFLQLCISEYTALFNTSNIDIDSLDDKLIDIETFKVI